MGSKLILLLGIILGSALTYFCIQENKTKLTDKYATANLPQDKNVTVQKSLPVPETIQEKQTTTDTLPTKTEEDTKVQPQILQKPTFFYSTKEHGVQRFGLAEVGQMYNMPQACICPIWVSER